jgi:hypothetical protein
MIKNYVTSFIDNPLLFMKDRSLTDIFFSETKNVENRTMELKTVKADQIFDIIQCYISCVFLRLKHNMFQSNF